ncbi:MAG: RIP metalloprotease RseP [Rhodobacterales bacterium]|nr:MAG: RIP metalloprotease RseP [Rhodobacterales bacterium]
MDFASLLPSFGGFAFTVLAFVVALMVIVFVHEMGHYLVGRWSGIKADVFSIGMGPRLWSRVDKHGTRWQIAALPIGGYVQFHGDANASSAGADEAALAQMDEQERRRTMHGAPLWARAATVAAGPVANFILSVVIYTAMALGQGYATDPLTVDRLYPIDGLEGTLAPGDEILAIDGRPIPELAEFGAFVDTLPDASPLEWQVRRAGDVTTIVAPHPYPAFVGAVTPQLPAAEAGLQAGDLIEAVDGAPINRFERLREIVGAGDGATLTLTVNRAGERFELALTPKRVDLPNPEGGFETRWLIGISGGLLFEPMRESPGLFEALWGGVTQVKYLIQVSLTGFYEIATGGISTCNIRGPIGIAETSGAAAAQGGMSFILLIAVLSTAIGLINLFPIPVLDGGHLVFHVWEALTGKPPSPRALSILTAIGLALVVSLMVFGLSNDLFCG